MTFYIKFYYFDFLNKEEFWEKLFSPIHVTFKLDSNDLDPCTQASMVLCLLQAVHFITFYVPLWGAILYNGITYFQVVRMLKNVTQVWTLLNMVQRYVNKNGDLCLEMVTFNIFTDGDLCLEMLLKIPRY